MLSKAQLGRVMKAAEQRARELQRRASMERNPALHILPAQIVMDVARQMNYPNVFNMSEGRLTDILEAIHQYKRSESETPF